MPAAVLSAPTGWARDGQILLTRQPDLDQVELALVDLAAGGDTSHDIMTVALPDIGQPAVSEVPGQVEMWLPNGMLLISPGRAYAEQPKELVLLVDLSTGEAHGAREWPDLLAELAPDLSVPADSDVILAPADELPPAAARHAF